MVVTVAAGSAVYLTRRAIAREVLIGWLEARGVPAEVEFREFEFGGFTARVRAGPHENPDLSVARVEVRYGFTGFWSGEPLGVRVSSVRLHSPMLKGSFKDGKLSLGSLDPLIEEFTKRPPQPDAPQPRVEIYRGLARFDTDYGLLRLRGDGRMQNGKLMALEARLEPVRLKGPGLEATLGEAVLRQATTRDRVDVLLVAPVTELKTGDLSARGGRLRLSLQGPYPDLKRRKGDGRVVAHLALQADGVAKAGDKVDGLDLAANFDGSVTGWVENLALQGDGDLKVSARGGEVAGIELAGLQADASLGDVRWTRTAGDVVSAEVSTRLAAASAQAGDLKLTAAKGDFGGLVAFDPRRVDVALRGAIAARGAWTGLGRPLAGDPAETAALKRALAGFQFTANSVAVSASRDGVAVSLGVPALVRTDSGGEIRLQRAGGPVYADGVGAFELKVAGGGLPQAELVVDRYRLTQDGLMAAVALKTKGGFAPVEAAELDAAGELRVAGGGVSFSASRCVPLSAGHVELGENDLKALSGRICPTSAPLLTLGDGAWRLRGRAEGVSAALPSLEARLSEASGQIDLRGAGASISGQVQLAGARIEDTAAETRFRPVRVSGRAAARGGGWTGGFSLADLAGRRLAAGDLRHGADGRGAIDFDTGLLTFEPGGLQPAAVSPMAAMLGPPVNGRAQFAGQIAWSPGASTSRGRLSVERLDFVSPMGPVVGLSGDVQFTSLIPLAAAPGQALRAQAINTLVPLTDVDVRFGLANEAAVVEGARLAVGDGTLSFEPFTIPFTAGQPWTGVVNFEGVQVKDLVEASPFGDRVDLEARLTGRVPFSVTPDGVRVAGGTLRAIEPGRLSILRETFTTVGAEGGEVTVPVPVPEEATPEATNVITEFAYQAMEHLAFTTLDAQVDSLPNGRLGVLMHLKGEHTPPQKQEIRLTIPELIRRDFLNKKLPLPSGTKVDLTLDTSLNLDQLLADFAEYQALRGSQAVQP